MTTSAVVICVLLVIASFAYLTLRLFFKNFLFEADDCQKQGFLRQPKDAKGQQVTSKESCEPAAESEDQWYAAKR